MNRWKYVLVGLLVGAFAFPLVWVSDPSVIGQTVTVDSTQSPLVVNALADLADLTPTDGQSVIIKTGAEKGLWYYDKDSATATSVSVLNGPGSVGRFLVINNDAGSVAAATAITAAEITDDGLLELQAFDGSSAKSLTIEELKKTGVQVVNVKQYGATGDGVTDDTTAIQAVLTSFAGVVPIYFPAGTYKITAALSVPSVSGVTIYGVGTKSKIAQHTAATNGVVCAGTSRCYNWTLRDFYVDTVGVTGATGIYLPDVSDSVLENVYVLQEGGGFLVGINIHTQTSGGSYRNFLYGCRVRAAAGASNVGLLLDGADDHTSNSHQVIGGQFRCDTGNAISIPLNGTTGQSDQNVVFGSSFEGSSAVGVYIAGASSSQGNVVSHCRFEGVTTGVHFDTGAHGNLALGNLYTSGVTGVVNTGANNFIMEPTTAGGSKLVLGRGNAIVNALQDTTRGAYTAELSTTGALCFDAREAGDTQPRWRVVTTGRMYWGPGGATAVDVGMRRSATATLEMESGTFDMNNKFVIDGGSTGPRILTGTGSPESVQTGPIGSVYTDTTGGFGSVLYLKQSGTGSTGWYPAAAVIAIEANTDGVGTPNVLVASESNKTLTNEGTTAANYHTLPTAVAGLTYTFVVQDADGLRITAATGDTIRLGPNVTATAGYIESTTIGDVVTATAINATEWVGHAYGTWTNGTWSYAVADTP